MAFSNSLKKYEKKAETLINEKKIKEIIFSNNTYEIEVQDSKNPKKTYWPFLQIDDECQIIDCFCTCAESEKQEGCIHIAAAYLRICQQDTPLHLRYQNSFFYVFCNLASKHFGYETKILKKIKKNSYVFYKDKKKLFSLDPLNKSGQKKVEEIISQRKQETETTSLKFSNLPLEEIALWRQGKASHRLRFELSFWSDIAKWLFLMQEDKKAYKIIFSDEELLPKMVKISFSSVDIHFNIEKEDWETIISSLNTVKASLKLYDFEENMIEKIIYDDEKKGFYISQKHMRIDTIKDKDKYPQIGSCYYVKNDGFYCYCPKNLFEKDFIEKKDVSRVLSLHFHTVKKFLLNATIHEDEKILKYHLYFDDQGSLHIDPYLFSVGDLNQPKVFFFDNWVYLSNKSFYLFNKTAVFKQHQLITKDKVNEFIETYRQWLSQFDGFQTHLGSLQMQMTYKFDGNKLYFDSQLDVPASNHTIIDLGEWVYIKNKGFYLKKSSIGSPSIFPGQCIEKNKLSSFIDKHYDELEQVHRFFTSKEPIEEIGLDIYLNDEGRIVIQPKTVLYPSYQEDDLIFLDHYVYIKDEGFYPLSPSMQLPKKFRKKRIIPKDEELYFLKFELSHLKKFAVNIDRWLQIPKTISLVINNISREKKKHGKFFLVDFVYVTDIGQIKVYDVYLAIQHKKKHLFSEAGLIDLQQFRFNWLTQIKKRQIHRTKKWIRINILQWIRLSSIETIDLPQPDTKEKKKMVKLIKEMESFESDEEIHLDALKAQLRPYQETGIHWLWFLYSNGLSGMLCDEMGLGKTHQAMALLASISFSDEKKNNKYLVVCPTSVIYHWQELLSQYLPSIKVYVYHGFERDIDTFSQKYQILLTSYGILRLEREKLSSFTFEVAIYDEMQMAKNVFSKTHKSIRSIQSKMRLGLTGTPIENYLQELKALFDLLLPHYLPNQEIFKDFFITPIEKNQDKEKKKMLTGLIRPFILRRKKQDVLLDLPEKMEEIAYCDLSEEQIQLYNQAISQSKKEIINPLQQGKKQISYMHIFALITKLKQICDHPSLLYKDVRSYKKHASGKWELFVELLREARESGQKVVVFSQYLNMLAIIESYLKRQSIGYAAVKGSTRNRAEEIKRFKEDPHCEVFVASLLAAGIGINLSSASVVIHYDRWWNPAKENQATDRVHRIGQTRGVQVFKLVAKNTIEERIHTIIEKKKGLIEETLGKDDSEEIKKLSKEELLAAFQEIPMHSYR